MAIQHFFTANSAIPFPQLLRGGAHVLGSAAQLRKLFWHAPAQKLVGVFTTVATDYEILSPGNSDLTAAWRLMYLWRDGSPLGLVSQPIRGYGGIFLEMTYTTTGTVLMANLPNDVARAEISATQGDALFSLSDRWAMDIIPVHAASAAVLGQRYDASYLTTPSAGYIVVNSVAQGVFKVLSKPSNLTMFCATGTTWRYPRDLIYINGERTAATFMQDSGGTINASAPALIRLFSTTSTAWGLLWTDTLPATDSVAAYDPQYDILYSAGKFISNAIIHVSKLKQAPVSLSTITLVSGSTLQEMRATYLSVQVQDSQGSGISGTLVQWTLSASVSGGSLLSAYSRTNTSGIAFGLYIGPRLSGATTTEAVCAVVATIDPVGV